MASRRVQDPARLCECGDHIWRKMNKWGVALVSPQDGEWLLEYHFSLARYKRAFYCQSSRLYQGHGVNLLHLALRVGPLADHASGNGLDNRRSNLRSATNSQNNANARKRRGTGSRYKGVSWRADKQKWRAYLVENGKQIFLGYFLTEETAAMAYDQAAKIRFGKFAKLNSPAPAAPITELA